ncbi:hypothetical protein Taro_029109 [Colocasia esculenta]|uniref:Uncharacterized protein n=1 Tax=Colocasia esculenta TaxID=4460 RepID=A0A843VQ56_COLES|nr:hypothetical protein [Colocasia esculenta]
MGGGGPLWGEGGRNGRKETSTSSGRLPSATITTPHYKNQLSEYCIYYWLLRIRIVNENNGASELIKVFPSSRTSDQPTSMRTLADILYIYGHLAIRQRVCTSRASLQLGPCGFLRIRPQARAHHLAPWVIKARLSHVLHRSPRGQQTNKVPHRSPCGQQTNKVMTENHGAANHDH